MLLTKATIKKRLEATVTMQDEIALTQLLLLHEINDKLTKLTKAEVADSDKKGTNRQSRKKA